MSRRYMHTLESYQKGKVRKTNFQTSQFFVLKNLIDVKIFVAIVLTFVNLCAFSLKAKNRIVGKLFQASFPSSVSRQNKSNWDSLLKLLIFYDFFDFLIHAYSGNLQKSIHFLIVFSMNFAWHNLRVLSADFQAEPIYLLDIYWKHPQLC